MNDLTQATVALLAISNPLGAVPKSLSLMEELDRRQRLRKAARSCIVVFVILTASALGGNWILSAVGISFPAFQAAGGS